MNRPPKYRLFAGAGRGSDRGGCRARSGDGHRRPSSSSTRSRSGSVRPECPGSRTGRPRHRASGPSRLGRRCWSRRRRPGANHRREDLELAVAEWLGPAARPGLRSLPRRTPWVRGNSCDSNRAAAGAAARRGRSALTVSADIGIFLMCIGAGLIGALVGVGGGIIVAPTLTTLVDVDVRLAIGASIVSVIATSSGASAA
jgi:hypothetical protein